MNERYTADLHIHSVLSPCGDLEMSPRAILDRARQLGLNLIAITDHNMVENSVLLEQLAPEYGIHPLYGMELSTQEEAHLLCLFDQPQQALDWQAYVYPRIPEVLNRPEYFGEQVVIDLEENILRFEKKLLINGSAISLEEACSRVNALGGLVIPSHIDKPVDSILSQIGFMPQDLCFGALEITRNTPIEAMLMENPSLNPFHWVRFSDAHYLQHIGTQCTLFHMQSPTIAEMRLALKNADGRSHELSP